MYIYGKQEPHGLLFTRKRWFAHTSCTYAMYMCGSQTDQNITRILVFWMIFWCFIRHLVWIWCDVLFAAGACASISMIRACACIRTYLVYGHAILCCFAWKHIHSQIQDYLFWIYTIMTAAFRLIAVPAFVLKIVLDGNFTIFHILALS